MRLLSSLSGYIERAAVSGAHEWHYLAVPIVTFSATALAHLVTHLFPQVTPSLAIPFLIFIIASFLWGNLLSALSGAAVLSAYTLVESGFDPWRAGQLVIASAAGAFLVISAKESLIRQTREAERGRRAISLVDEADKSLDRLKGMHKRVSQIVQGWAVMEDAARFDFMVNHRGELANILQFYDGFHQLYLEIEAVKWNTLQQKLARSADPP
jgi:hypothetical protein